MAATATRSESGSRRWRHAADKVTLHPVIGPILLAAIMFVMFQAVFAWAERPMALIEEAIGALQAGIAQVKPDGFVQSLLADGGLAGVGSVVVFPPQTLILFLFTLLLEQSCYMVRASFLMDMLMARVVLSRKERCVEKEGVGT